MSALRERANDSDSARSHGSTSSRAKNYDLKAIVGAHERGNATGAQPLSRQVFPLSSSSGTVNHNIL